MVPDGPTNSNGTTPSLDERLQRARTQVEQARSVLTDSLLSLRHTVGDSVSLGYWVSRQPWACLIGAATLGYLAGKKIFERTPL